MQHADPAAEAQILRDLGNRFPNITAVPVAEAIDHHALPNVVVDPVMVAKSGDRLLEESATEAPISAL